MPTTQQGKTLSKMGLLAKVALLAALTPKLAADAKPETLSGSLDLVLKDVKRKNWLTKKPGIMASLKPMLATDTELSEITELLDRLDTEAKGPDDITADSPADAVLEKLRGKISDEDLAEIKSMIEGMGAKAATDETPEEKEKREKAEAEAKAKKQATDNPPKTAGTPEAPYKDKAAMDAAVDARIKVALDAASVTTAAAIKTAREQGAKDAIATARAIGEAESAVHPAVGKLNMAFDSAEGVYKAALEHMQVDVKNVHPSAYRAIFEARQVPKPKVRLASDAGAVDKSFAAEFPDAQRLQSA